MGHLTGRRPFVLGLAAAASVSILPSCTHGTRPKASPQIGFMIGDGFPSLETAFYEEMRRLGYVDGRNIEIEARKSAGPSDLRMQAAELAQMNLDFIVVAALPQALAVRAANPAMPMVVGTAPGLVANGFAKSLEHPDGNTTGMDELPAGLTGKRLRFLKEAAPNISRVALLSTTPGTGGHEAQLADAELAAHEIGVTVRSYRAAAPADVDVALDAIARDRMEGLVNFQGGLSLGRRDTIVQFLEARRIPAIYQSKFFVEAGGLMSYAPDQEEQFRMAARYADRILRGARPGDLPILHPARYYLTINQRAAAAIGLPLPASLIARADFVVS